MSYEVGTHIDLSHLNRKPVIGQKKTTFQETVGLFEVGTRFVFTGGKAARQIPVVFA